MRFPAVCLLFLLLADTSRPFSIPFLRKATTTKRIDVSHVPVAYIIKNTLYLQEQRPPTTRLNQQTKDEDDEDGPEPHPPDSPPPASSQLRSETRPYFVEVPLQEELKQAASDLGNAFVQDVVAPIFSTKVAKGVSPDKIKGAALTGATLSLLAGAGLPITGAAGLGAALIAISPGKGGDALRAVGGVTWDAALRAAQLYETHGSKLNLDNTTKALVSTALENLEKAVESSQAVALEQVKAQSGAKSLKEGETEATPTGSDAKAKEAAGMQRQTEIEAQKFEEDRLEAIKRKEEAARIAEQKKKEDEARKEAEALKLEEEAARLEQEALELEMEAQREAEAEARRLEEEARLAAEEARKAEEARIAAEKEEARIAAEEARKAEEAEKARIAAEEARKSEEAEKARIAAEEARKEETRMAEAARLAEEADRIQEQAMRDEEARLEELAEMMNSEQEISDEDWEASVRLAQELDGKIAGLGDTMVDEGEKAEWNAARQLAAELGKAGPMDDDEDEDEEDMETLAAAARAAVEQFEAEIQDTDFDEEMIDLQPEDFEDMEELEDVGAAARLAVEMMDAGVSEPDDFQKMPTDWSKLTVPQLKDELKTRGLKSSGKKADLIAALTASDLESPSVSEPDDDDFLEFEEEEEEEQGFAEIVEEPEGQVDIDYESMTVAELKDELRNRGLKLSGKKAELIERLSSSS